MTPKLFYRVVMQLKDYRPGIRSFDSSFSGVRNRPEQQYPNIEFRINIHNKSDALQWLQNCQLYSMIVLTLVQSHFDV